MLQYPIEAILTLSKWSKMPKTEYGPNAITYAAHGTHYILDNIEGSKTQQTRPVSNIISCQNMIMQPSQTHHNRKLYKWKQLLGVSRQ